MSEIENTGVNELEVAEPTTDDTGVNESEVAEPIVEEGGENHKNTPHQAWAEMRKAREEAERKAAQAEKELAELKATSEARKEALRRITGTDDGDVAAIAESIGVEANDVLQTIQAQEESIKKDLYIQELEKKVSEVSAERQLQDDLLEVQKIDPTVTSLYELGDMFLEYRKKEVSAEAAYWACKAKKEATQMKAPKAPGKAGTGEVEKEYFTEEEVDAMTPEQQKANYPKIIKSMPHW